MRKKLLLLFAVLATAINASAYDFEVDGIYYNYVSKEGLTCEVTSGDNNSGDIVIPSTVSYNEKTYSVTSIGNNAFYNCTGLTSVVIPESVTTIGNWAFSGCSDMKWVSIPESVTSIGDYVFLNCESLTSVEIPESVTSIGEKAFSSCKSLTSVEIPNTVISIGESAFFNCSKLTSVTIGNSVTSIGKGAFNSCIRLKSVEIPNSVTKIGDYAFCCCWGLTSFTGKFASEDKRSLIIDGVLNSFAPANLTTYTIPNSVTSIGEVAFAECYELTSVTIPESVTSIGKQAFYGCKKLTTITSYAVEPPSIIGEECFYNVSTSTCTVNVPKAAVSAYQEADGWKKFNNISGLSRSYDLNISSGGIATLWLDYDATIPTGAEVYYATYNSATNMVTMNKIEKDVLPRETGVIVKGTAGKYTFGEASTAGTPIAENMLVGSSTAKMLNEPGYKYYKLAYNSSRNDYGFYLGNADGTIQSKANRAYLRLPASSSSRVIGIDWGDEGATDIESTVDFDKENGTLYNLQGMPVSNDYKGIVIKRSTSGNLQGKNSRKMLNK